MKTISPIELKSIMDKTADNIQLIDKINMYEIPDKIDKISKNKKVVIYCRSGSRSANIVNLLEKNFSFDNIYNLDGGIMRWRDEIDSSLKSY